MNKPQFWPCRVNVAWGVDRKELPYVKENFKEYVEKTYFLNDEGFKRPKNETRRFTPKGNRFDYVILVENKMFSEENESDYDILTVNYWMSDLNVGQKQGNSFWFVKDYNIRYRQNGEQFYELTITLDEWATFYEEILPAFNGSVLKTGGHEHDWIYDKENDSFWPNYKENLGLLSCTEVCNHKNTLYFNDIEKDKFLNAKDVIVLFLTAPLNTNKILKTTIYNERNIDPLNKMNANNPTTNLLTGNKTTDSGFIIRILYDTEENRRHLNGLIETLENPIISGVENLFSSITVSKKIGNQVIPKTSINYEKSFWEWLEPFLEKETDLANDFLGGGYKIQAVKKMSLSEKTLSQLERKKYLIPVGQSQGLGKFTDKEYTNNFSNWKLIEVLKGVDNYKNDGFLYELSEQPQGPYTKVEKKEKTTKTEIIPLEVVETEKELNLIHKEDIAEKKLTPHLFTTNHFQLIFSNFFNQTKSFDLTDIVWDKEKEKKIIFESQPVLSSSFNGYQNKISFPSGKLSKENKNIEGTMFLNSLKNENYPFNRDVYNEWAQQNANSIQTSAINAKKTFELEKREAKRQFIGSMISGVLRTGVSVASAALTGGASIGLATAQSAVAATSEIGQGLVNVAKTGAIANTGNAVGSGVGGIIGSIIARKNAIDEARTKEQNSLRAIGASVLDTQNNPDNLGEGIDTNLLIQEVNASMEKTAYETTFFRLKEVNEIDKDLIWYDRNQYGSSYTRFVKLKGLESQFSHYHWNYLRLEGFNNLINPLAIPSPIKDLISFTFAQGVIIHDLEKLETKSTFDYSVDNFDIILNEQKGKYEMSTKIFKEAAQYDGFEIEKIIDLSPTGGQDIYNKSDLITSKTLFGKIIISRLGERKEPLGVSTGGEVVLPINLFEKNLMSFIQTISEYDLSTNPMIFANKCLLNWDITGAGTTSPQNPIPKTKLALKGYVQEMDSKGDWQFSKNYYAQLVFYKKAEFTTGSLNLYISVNNKDVKTFPISIDTRINLIQPTESFLYDEDGWNIKGIYARGTTPDLITLRNEETIDISTKGFIAGSAKVENAMQVNSSNIMSAKLTSTIATWTASTKEKEKIEIEEEKE